jgi:hypothetical protein
LYPLRRVKTERCTTVLKAAVVFGFEVKVQTLLVKETKTLDDDAKDLKKYWQQQIGSKMKDLKNGWPNGKRSKTGKAKAWHRLRLG